MVITTAFVGSAILGMIVVSKIDKWFEKAIREGRLEEESFRSSAYFQSKHN